MPSKVAAFPRQQFASGNTTEAVQFEVPQAWWAAPIIGADNIVVSASVSSSPAYSYDPVSSAGALAIQHLTAEVGELKSVVGRLAEAVTALAASINPEAALVARDVPESVAKSEIVTFLRSHAQAYPSDIAHALNLDYELVTKVLERLREDGAAAPVRKS